MPTSARKSSVGGARRGPQKAHQPYRGDNPEVGRKTGIAVQHVERKSDGFEPFEELLQRADVLTPPQKRARKKSLAAANQQDDDYDEDDGEQSMQLDSPVQRLVNMRPPVTPTTTGRRSSVRPVAPTSDVDFDRIPSPRASGSAHRSGRNAGVGPSSLSRSIRHNESDPASDSPDEGGGMDYDNGGEMDPGGFDDYGPQEDESPEGGNFSRIEEEGEQEEEDEEEEDDQDATPKASTRHEKGKGKAGRPRDEEPQDQDEELEDEIAQGMEDVDLEPESDASQEQPPPKKAKTSNTEKKKPARQSTSRKKKENRPEREGTRRSARARIEPLDWWRGERYVYGKKENHAGRVLVPPVKEIIRIPVDPIVPLGKRKRASTRPRSKSRGHADDEGIAAALPVVNPEAGWDDDTEAKCVVLRYTTREEVERRIAWTAKMVTPKMAADHNWSFDKIFGDDDFIAAGQLVIPPRGRKPSKAAKDNTYVFFVIEGAVNFKIHDTSMILSTGGMFLVPRGNTYFIENISNRDAKLFFTQARKVEMDAEEMAAKEAQAAEAQRRRSLGRSSSVGAPSTGSKTSVPNGRAASLAVFPTSKTSKKA